MEPHLEHHEDSQANTSGEKKRRSLILLGAKSDFDSSAPRDSFSRANDMQRVGPLFNKTKLTESGWEKESCFGLCTLCDAIAKSRNPVREQFAKLNLAGQYRGLAVSCSTGI